MPSQSDMFLPVRLDLGALESSAVAATHRAALACCSWVGRHDADAADGAATEAMRRALANVPGRGTVVIGEGEKDNAPMLFNGEVVGDDGGGPDFDIAVDPLEGTSFCAKDSGSPAATRICSFTRSRPVTSSVTPCSTWMRVFISMK